MHMHLRSLRANMQIIDFRIAKRALRIGRALPHSYANTTTTLTIRTKVDVSHPKFTRTFTIILNTQTNQYLFCADIIYVNLNDIHQHSHAFNMRGI